MIRSRGRGRSEAKKSRLLEVVEVDPLEAARVVVERVELGAAAVEVVQILHQRSHPGVDRVGEEMPIELRVVVPLAPGGELAPHEYQLSPGVGVHHREERTEIGGFCGFSPASC